MENNEIYKNELNALRAEYEEKLALKEAECALLRKNEKEAQDAKNEKKKKTEDYLNEYVSIKLFKDNDKYKDDVYVAVNGKNCVIKRGEWVKVRRKFAMVLKDSEIQDMKTAKYLEEESARFMEECQGNI